MGCGSSTEDRKSAAPTVNKPLVVFVLGGPGAGKGTQCANMVRDYGFVHLSAGDLLRAEQGSGSKDAELINNYIKEGKIVPVEITAGLLRKAIEAQFNAGRGLFLVDGFPRNIENENGWNRIVGSYAEVAFCLFFDCPEDVMEKRLLKRGETSGRVDDNAEAIKKRFRTFQQETMPVVNGFASRNKLRQVSATSSPEQVYAEVRKILDAEAQIRGLSTGVAASAQASSEKKAPPAKRTVAVITGNSNTGFAAVQALAKKYHDQVYIRALVRTDDKKAKFQELKHVDVVAGIDATRPDAADDALFGVDSCFITSPNFAENRAELQIALVDAAKKAGVKHVVLMSVQGAQWEAITFAKQFRKVEKHLEASGLAYTHIRASMFMDNFIGSKTSIVDGGAIYGCHGEGKYSTVAMEDLGNLIAECLVHPQHRNKAYDATGPDTRSGAGVAAAFTQVLGYPVKYVDVDPVEYSKTLVGFGWPKWQADGLVELMLLVKDGKCDAWSPDIKNVTGQHTSLEQWITNNKATFQKAPGSQVTFAFIKPDVVAAGKSDEMLAKIKAAGFDVVGQNQITLAKEVAEEFYGEHKGKPFFDGLVGFMTSGPAVALALRKDNAILDWRAALGPTNTEKARLEKPDSLRALFGTDGQRNAGHGSDSVASADRELHLIFPEIFEPQTTFAFIKPDVVAAGKADAMLASIKALGFDVAAQKELTLSKDLAEEFYGEHKGKPFFDNLVGFMTSGPAVALALRKPNAILEWRAALGPTNSDKARAERPGSLRAVYGTDGQRNAGHGSDSVASAQRELKLLFPDQQF